MSSMAKIFVVLNLVLGVAAFGSAATLLGAQDDYKVAFEGATAKFDDYKQAKTSEIIGLNRDRTDAEGKATAAINKANVAEASQQQTKTELKQAKSANEKLMSTVETSMKELTALREIISADRTSRDRYAAEATDARKKLADMRKKFEDEAGNRAQLEVQLSNQSEEMQALAAKLGDCETALRAANFTLNKYRQRYGPLMNKGQGAPGRVNAVKGSLVTLSVGIEDGVRNGDRYQISRGDQHCGELKIIKVYKNMAVGEFDTRFMGPGGMPQVGDVAEVR